MTALAAANRWTGTLPAHARALAFFSRPHLTPTLALAFSRADNIFSIQSYCGTNFGISGSDFLAQFDLPETFDSINEGDALAPPPAASGGLKWKKASEEPREQAGDDMDGGGGGDMD